MKAVVKLLTRAADGTEKQIESDIFSTDSQTVLLSQFSQDTIVVQLWHGPCLESEVEIKQAPKKNTSIKLISRKELRANPPPEAVCK